MCSKPVDIKGFPFRKGGLGPVRTLGDPILKQKAPPVTEFDSRLERLAKSMLVVMEREEGVGLAATQVGLLTRVMVWRHPDKEEEQYVFVNPEILERSEACSTQTEGCLSVPGASMEVTRAEEVVIKAQDVKGDPIQAFLSGMLARIVQHEVDHLDGYLILDRASPEERRRALKELREQAMAGET